MRRNGRNTPSQGAFEHGTAGGTQTERRRNGGTVVEALVMVTDFEPYRDTVTALLVLLFLGCLLGGRQ